MSKWDGKKFLVLGAGKSGLGMAQLLSYLNLEFCVIDAKNPKQWSLKEDFLNISTEYNLYQEGDQLDYSSFDYLLKSPGVPWENSIIEQFEKNRVLGEIDFVTPLLNEQTQVIAITGTNGKTTTTTMVGELLRIAQIPAFIGGNIGTAYSEIILSGNDYEVCVLELSSFQLENIQSFRPHIAALLNFSPSHGERYDHHDDYLQAKLNIFLNMNSEDEFIVLDSLKQHYEAPAKLTSISDGEIQKLKGTYDLSQFKLVGEHNLYNLAFTDAIRKSLGLSEKVMQELINSFAGVEHRVERLNTDFDFEVFNDAKSTNWEATKTAIKSFNGKKVSLILGGQRRGNNDSILPHLDYMKTTIDQILLIGETADELANEIDQQIPTIIVNDLSGLKKYISKNPIKEVLLFSPGFPSFDQFKNYVDRGNQFKKLF